MSAVNLSLCGCGFLGIYHLGVATCLVEHAPTLLRNIKRVGGASAGSLAGTALILGRHHLQKSVEFSYALAEEIRRKPLGAFTPGYNLLESLHNFLLEQLPSDVHVTASGKLHVSLSTLKGRKNEIVSEFTSKEHLIKCLLATSYIPLYAGINPPQISGTRYMDGGLTNNLVEFTDGRTITVSPFAGKQDISPRDRAIHGLYIRIRKQNYQISRTNGTRVIDAFFPPDVRTLERYYKTGYRDAELFLKNNSFYEHYERIDVCWPKETSV